MNCNKPVKVEYIGDMPIDNLESLPDYILAERDVEDPSDGNVIRSMVRVPAKKLFPQGNMDNLFSIEANNEAIVVPENEVRACRITAIQGVATVEYADATHPAQFFALGEQGGMLICQNTGVINIPNGHDYVLSAQYYTSADGVPVTDPASGDKLFIPISRTKLLITRA